MAKKSSALLLLLPVILACAAVAVAISFLPKTITGGAQENWELSLTLEGRPFVAGNTAMLHAFSTCGAYGVFLDGNKMGSSDMYLDLPLMLSEGSHTLSAKGDGCQALLPFEVEARECSGNQSAPCAVQGCEGVRYCIDGKYSEECSLPKKVCMPGEKIGCSTDGCKFGHATCNPCGSGFGNCTDDGNKNGTACASGSSCN